MERVKRRHIFTDMNLNEKQQLTKRKASEIFGLFSCLCSVLCQFSNLFMILGTRSGKLKG